MFFTIENLRYAVTVKGSGRPIICLHGFAENSSTWEYIRLDNCQMVLVDLIGHGLSDKPHSLEPYLLPALLEQLHALIRRLGFDQYSLLGYSMGGRIALAYALTYPQEVLRLILESSSYGLGDDQRKIQRRQQDIWLANSIQENGIEWFNDYWSGLELFASQKNLPRDIREKIRERRLQNDSHALANTLLATGQGIYPCLQNEVLKLTMPVLYINGEYDEKYQKVGQEFAELNTGIKREIIAGAGHNTHIEKPQAFCDAVQSFLVRSSGLNHKA